MEKTKRIRIGIDGHMIGDHSGGNETYYRNILQHMNFPSDWEVYLFLKPEADSSPYENRFHIRRFTSSNAIKRNFVELPKIIKHLELDLLHTQYFIPFFSPCPVVCTIHDICFEHFKDIFTRSEYVRQKLLIPYAAKKSKAVFTVSEFSKQDIVEKYGVNPEQITVTYNAVDEKFRRLDTTELDETQLRERFGIGDNPFILTVGNLQPRKNLPRLIGAFKKLQESTSVSQCRADLQDYKLVIVGKKAWMYDSILKLSDDKNIILTDYISETDLIRLYNVAELFVYPSFFEGFGLPPLEAMACGTPVIVSNVSALPEVVGDAGMYFDPLNMDSIADTMGRMIMDKDMQDKLIKKGFQRVKEFSWEKSAKQIVEKYIRLIEQLSS